MNPIKVFDEYLVSSFYTAGALIANGVSEAYFTHNEITRRQEPVDIVITCLFAAAISGVFAFIRKRRFRVLGVLSSLGLWVVRAIMGFFLFGISTIEDNHVLLYWILTGMGVLLSSIALIGQYLRHRTHYQEKTATIEPVKVRFV
jgi:protein-S-isoprenylcysteine O-methyltransferase Ste14